jgi:hypothetical protein
MKPLPVLLLMVLALGCAPKSQLDLNQRVEPIAEPSDFDIVQQTWQARHRLVTADESGRLRRVPMLHAPSYDPTWREMFDALGRIAGGWRPGGVRRVVFVGRGEDRGFAIEAGSPFVRRESGDGVMLTAPGAGVAINVRRLGDFSAASADRIAAELALTEAQQIDPAATAGDITIERLATYDAAHWQQLDATSGNAWRHWVVTEQGRAYLVRVVQRVPESTDLPPIVLVVLDSFRVTR